MTITFAHAVNTVATALDAKLTADDTYLQAVLTLGQASTDGIDVKSVHTELDRLGYGDMLKLTRCYAMAFAGQLLALQDADDFAVSERTVVSTMLRAYNVKGGAVAIRRILRKAGQTRQGAYSAADAFGKAPKSSTVTNTTTDTSITIDPAGADVDAIIASITALVGGLAKRDGSAAQHAAALALSSRMAVWGGIPAQGARKALSA